MSVNVRRYKGGKWLVDVWTRRAGGKLARDRHVVGGTKPQARNWGLERERTLLDGRGKVEKPASTFEAFATDWMTTYPSAAGNSHTTIRSKRGHVNAHLVPFFGPLALDRIDRRLIDKFIAHLFTLKVGKPEAERVRKVGTGPHPIAPRTVQHVMSTLRKILNSAVEWGELETAPKFPRVKIPEQAFKFYDADEARRLIAAGAGLEDRALLTFALHSGCRAGEQLAVRWDDLDMKLKIVTFSRSSTRGIVRDSTKSGKLRTVPLTDALLDVLRELRAARALVQLDGDDLVFAGPDGEPLNVDRLHRVLRRAQKRAGLREGRWHDLRHSYASILTMAGTPIRNVQSWLGHATIGMTMRYSHLAPDHGREHLAAAFALPKPQATLRPRQPSRERQYQKT